MMKRSSPHRPPGFNDSFIFHIEEPIRHPPIDQDVTTDLGVYPGSIVGVSCRRDDLADPHSLDAAAGVGIGFDGAVEAVLLDHAAARVDRILFAALLDGFDHFGAGIADLGHHSGPADAAFRAEDCLVSVLLPSVEGTQADSVHNSVQSASRDIFVEAVLHTDWTCCIGVGPYHRSFRTRYQTLTLPVPTSSCSSRLLTALPQMPLSLLGHALGP